MAMGPERSRPLHYFTLPGELKWGNRKFMRCVKLDSSGEFASVHRRPNGFSECDRAAPDRPKIVTGLEFGSCFDAGIASVREKLILDLQTATDRIKDAIFRMKEKEKPPAAAAAAADANKPWNLRTRRTTYGSTQNVSPLKDGEKASPALPPARSEKASPLKRERVRVSVPLTRPEIEADFMAMVGHKPARRPKKRSKVAQKNLDTLFPGSWLKEISADLYKVSDD